jgi:GTP cyclohydrolase FolE2
MTLVTALEAGRAGAADLLPKEERGTHMSRVIQLMTLGEGRSLTRKIDGTENCEKRCHHETTGNSQERQTRTEAQI